MSVRSLCLFLVAIPTTFGQDLFRDRVARVLQSQCLRCHNDIDKEGGFSLQSAKELAGSGYIEPGDPDGSTLLDVIGGGNQPATMPKDGKPLKPAEIQAVRLWIESGAKWPDGFILKEPTINNFEWWSLKPVKRPRVPTVPDADTSWIRNPIDAFILARQQQRGLTHSTEADRRTLIRRVTFDLTGLPPTPEDITAFQQDESPDAYEKLVDRLLQSKHYGERWAQHWLDVARYADTCGYDKDKLRQNAWPYRDYVIRSINTDKPYSQFVKEQIAGDVLYPNTPDSVLGLGFIAAGPWDFIGHVEVPESKLDGKEARNLDRDEMVTATMNAFCSITVQCARCHNHKFDPITQQHYYSLQSIFAAVDRAERPYDADPKIASQRQELAKSLELLRRDQADLEAFVRRAGGPELRDAEAEIQRLRSIQKVRSKPPEFGYHSTISSQRDVEKWVQIDLGRVVELNRIVLHPCHDDFAGIGAGFGFPERFEVLVGRTPNNLRVVVDRTATDFVNPGLSPVELAFPAGPQKVRFVRVNATRLRERKDDFILALAELEAIDATNQNVAMRAAVSAKDTINAPVRWRDSNLTDGLWPRASEPNAAKKMSAAVELAASIRKRIETPDTVARRMRVRTAIRETQARLKVLPSQTVVYAAATQFKAQGNFKPTMGKPREVRVLHRGNITQPKQPVQPGVVPTKADGTWQLPLPADHTEGQRRAALAEWIVRKDNPLTWRSIVNRIWLHHFGRGLVATPNDFGRMGQLPTHPQLLDWLATEFRDNGESFKKLHRLIVTSSTYRQNSVPDPANARIDDDNRFLWRTNRRRLEAEELRDAVLAVSGRMNTKMGGPGYFLFKLEKTAHSPHYEYQLFDPNDERSHRRSLYRFIVRSQPDPFMTTLDCADASQSTPRRSETLTSLQALSLMNNRFVLAMSKHFAERLKSQQSELSGQVQRGFQLVAGRKPRGTELSRLVSHAQNHGLTATCRLLLNLSEFCYID